MTVATNKEQRARHARRDVRRAGGGSGSFLCGTLTEMLAIGDFSVWAFIRRQMPLQKLPRLWFKH
ncbi:MAG: hypothetical protein COW28_04355 [bacterium (Candidatus Ratteibacteria) CG15_BIG_FIL_POST_REV_8_21_14_020_41_12]|uniref:Uncharacterized protein n=1 Tax=bacterium (Candidatus Ratteibacteria) CG15_BIG_FIL_POST_REV_8_21_14_020_41_12 TaxID=2014291 RepID=A0A2M7GYG1_9BACT|nr:MAG: hypothetical protein COW28_04355 [bacterium (Candidatus Ratteibacteria) CG15_BIG_FIL_POST_REV_8_21_14_020_41_12]